MQGDFSRDTFDPAKRFLRVLMQQGRVQLDADWNEQVAILVHHLQCVAEDVFGDAGGPRRRAGFAITPRDTAGDEPLDLEPAQAADLAIGTGRYYVDGRLCENTLPATYMGQVDFPRPDAHAAALKQPPYLVYLDVWERYVSVVEDEALREVALGGPDTTARSRTVWQVKVAPLEPADVAAAGDPPALAAGVWERLLQGDPVKGIPGWQPSNRGRLAAQAAVPGSGPTDPCIIAPDHRYRGPENQLYRVEIHQGGKAGARGATFKWSRENGSVALPFLAGHGIRGGSVGATVPLATLGRDRKLGLKEGDWVEIVDDDRVLVGAGDGPEAQATVRAVDPLLRVLEIDPDAGQVTLATDGAPVPTTAGHPFLRRWDHRQRPDGNGNGVLTGGALPIREGEWIDLEDGIQVRFDEDQTYRTGDYWLITARTATGDVEWPRDDANDPTALPPRGVEHHYAPLALVTAGADGKLRPVDLRSLVGPGS